MAATDSSYRPRLGLIGAIVLAMFGLAMAAASPAGAAKVEFKSGGTALALDPQAAGLLTSAGISVAPIDPAAAKADGSIEFPVTGGRVNPESLAGKVNHSGGLTLSSSSASVELRDFVIDTRKAELTALVGSDRVAILSLDLEDANVKVNAKRGKVKVAGVEARLTQAAADALNAAFGTSAFAEGAKLGEATLKAKVG